MDGIRHDRPSKALGPFRRSGPLSRSNSHTAGNILSPSLIRESLPRSVAIGAGIAIGLAAWLLYSGSGALGIAVSDRDRAFTAADPAWSQALVPALSVPHGWLPSSAIGRASRAIAQGRLTAIRDLATTVTAVTVAVFGVLLIGAGLEAFAVLLATAGLAVSPTFWWRGVSWSADTMAPLFALLAAWMLWRGLRDRQAVSLAAALACAALAIAEDPSWLAVAPAAAMWARRRLPIDNRNLIVTSALILLVLCAGLSLLDRWLVARALAGTAVAGAAVPDLLELWRVSIFAVPPPSLETLRGPFIGELTVLGAAVALGGVAHLVEITPQRAAAAVALAGLLLWLLVVPRAESEGLSVPLAMAGWTTVAVALSWLRDKTKVVFGIPAIAFCGAFLVYTPVMTRVQQAYPPNARHDLELRARSAAELPMRDIGPELLFVAETRRSDATLLLSSRRAGRPATIVPQRADQLAAAFSRDRVVAALPAAATNLEANGFLFVRRPLGNAMLAISAGRVQCVDLQRGEWRDILPQAAAGSIAIHGASPDARPGEVRLTFRGVSGNPVRRTSPARVRYLLPPSAAGESTLQIPQARRGPPIIAVTLSARPSNASATVDSEAPTRICGHLPEGEWLIGPVIDESRAINLSSRVFRTGWHHVEADPDPFRWTGAERALMVIGVAAPRAVRVSVTARPAADARRGPAIALSVNDCEFSRRPMHDGQSAYEWDVEGRCWMPGGNRVWLSVTPLVSPPDPGDTRRMGARIGAVRLTPLD